VYSILRFVGLGGLPDRDGKAGSVCFVQGIAHPISLARMVMEQTPHVMLVGAGAERFAREGGITQQANTLSKQAREAWEAWRVESKYKPLDCTLTMRLGPLRALVWEKPCFEHLRPSLQLNVCEPEIRRNKRANMPTTRASRLEYLLSTKLVSTARMLYTRDLHMPAIQRCLQPRATIDVGAL